MNSLTDTQQQAVAARGNVLVSAGAGTGKTSTLVQRCLSLLAEGCSLEDMLLVTFTEAAAVEMRGRIREALQQKTRELEGLTDTDANQLEHFRKQLMLLDTAAISTLHSFCLQLVREHFYELGIDPDVTVLDERQAQPLIQHTLDAILERHYAGETEPDRAVQSLVRGLGRGSDDRIRALVLKLHRYSQARDNPASWFEQQRAVFHETDPTQWRGWFVSGFFEWRKPWVAVLEPLAGTPAVALSLVLLQNIPETPAAAEVGEALRAIRAADKDKANWPHGSKTSVRSRIRGFFEEAGFLASLAPSGTIDPLAEDWELVRQDMQALLDLAREFTTEFGRAKREAGGVDFADLEQFALQVLRDPPTAAHWQQQLEYLFVDEYQDINAAQDAILRALSRTGRAANRFLVGDVKQSIYRFRLADPTIFRNYEASWSHAGTGSQRVPLSDNFRSRQEILDFVNPLFRALMRENAGGVVYEDLKFGNARPQAAPAGDESGAPRVELHLIARSDGQSENGDAADEETAGTSEVSDLLVTEREARLVALRLRELKAEGHEIRDRNGGRFRPVQWNDMAVLLRSPAHRVEAFAREFSRLGIPLAAARGGFFGSVEISDLVSLLKLLDNPLQDIPLLAVLRSPLVGMAVGELAEIRAHEAPDQRTKYFWLAARQFHRQKTESGPAWRKLDLFLEQLNRWRNRVRQTSLSTCLEVALNETRYESLLRANPRGEEQVANVRRLLNLAREYDPYQRQGLFRFLRFVAVQEELEMEFEPVAVSRDAVQLMSIHRSKGLEFPVVALAGLGWRFNFRDLHENILIDERYGLCPKILVPGGEQSYPSLPYWLAQRRQRGEQLGEELRLWYVAMTRARDTLVLFATGTRKGDTKWGNEDGNADENGSEKSLGIDDRKLLSAQSYLDWLKLWLRQVTRECDWSADREGRSKLLRWTVYSENDRRLALPEPAEAEKSADPEKALAPADIGLADLRARLNRAYPFVAATRLKAKTSVTELRQRLAEQEADAEPAGYLRRDLFHPSTRPRDVLGAAEVGIVHHRFLQRVNLARVGGVETLQREAERMEREGWLNGREKAVLDLAGLAEFWQSDYGRRIVFNAAAVQRELPFTARFTVEELAGRGEHVSPEPRRSGASTRENSIPPTAGREKDFVVVQGVVDLAVILPAEIWLVDFKTDEIGRDELKSKSNLYRPQVRSYAMALERIYQRPVTEGWLHFLSARATVAVDLA